MAFSDIYKYNVKNPKNVQYYPQTYDEDPPTMIAEEQERYTNKKGTNKRFKNTLHPTRNRSVEKKSPIYVHQYHAPKKYVYPNYPPNKMPLYGEVLKNRANNVPKNSKITLDKLEETYWATWKPKKDSELKIKPSIRGKSSNNKNVFSSRSMYQPKMNPERDRPAINKNQRMAEHGDAKRDLLFTYLNSSNVESSGAEEVVTDVDEKLPSEDDTKGESSANSDLENNVLPQSSPRIATASQEIQTPKYSLIDIKPVSLVFNKRESTLSGRRLSPIMSAQESNVKSSVTDLQPITPSSSKSEAETCITNYESSVTLKASEKKEDIKKEHDCVTKVEPKQQSEEIVPSKPEPPEEVDLIPTKEPPAKKTEDNNKLLKHTDSYEIIKKKQEENESKEHYQQPRCIRLYRKSGVTPSPTTASYIKGGTYTLKSCLKKDAGSRGNFKLGAPGSNLFVTVNSYLNRRRF